MLKFSVAAPSRGAPAETATAVLQQDNWNDYSYRTQYHLYYFGEEYHGLVGNVKILKLGQREGSAEVLPVGALAPLSDKYCSLGQSLDYYERLAGLPVKVRNEILLALRDALTDPDHAKRFAEEPGWGTSVLRDLDLESYRLLALVLLERDYNSLPSMGLDLAFQAKGWQKKLKLNFAGPDSPVKNVGRTRLESGLPERVAVITGRNGSGKSTLLARLARVLHASQTERARRAIRRLGSIKPPGVGFTRIIAVSYSAFDTFHIPGITRADKKQMVADLQAGIGRYVFCGLRDVVRELQEALQAPDERQAGDAEREAEEGWDFDRDRQHRTYLKSADALADEFARTVERIFDAKRTSLLHKALRILLTDASLADVPDQSPSNLLTPDPRAMFMGRSTGHKIVLHTVATLVAFTQRKSIVLLDEPETHLHPPLLATLMHAVRMILTEEDSFAIIATHSPVVAQETLGQHVSIVRRDEDVLTIRPAQIETYGESVGEITEAVFGLRTDATDYHLTLDGLIDRGLSPTEINRLFKRGLSMQARAYVLSRAAERDAGVLKS